MLEKIVQIGDGDKSIKVGNDLPFILIAGQCVIEDEYGALKTAEFLQNLCQKLEIELIYKSSDWKDNRTRYDSYKGPGEDQKSSLEIGIKIFEKIRAMGCLITTDFHTPDEAAIIAPYIDLVQIPALLGYQDSILEAAANTGKPINIKKPQITPYRQAGYLLEKLESYGATNVLITERGSGMRGEEIVDPLSIEHLVSLKYPVVMDATHPSHGRKNAPGLAFMALGKKISAIFMETHFDPDNALCDGPNMMELSKLEECLKVAKDIDSAIKGNQKLKEFRDMNRDGR